MELHYNGLVIYLQHGAYPIQSNAPSLYIPLSCLA